MLISMTGFGRAKYKIDGIKTNMFDNPTNV